MRTAYREHPRFAFPGQYGAGQLRDCTHFSQPPPVACLRLDIHVANVSDLVFAALISSRAILE